jgi:hypothetical protein
MTQTSLTFKRNQVEAAVAEATNRTGGPTHAPNRVLATRLKRLIETDRAMPLRATHGSAGGFYAFFEEQPPGQQGIEVQYTAYGAFALYVAVRLLDAGMPQSDAVVFMRRIRPRLEEEHDIISRKRPSDLIDHDPPYGLEREVKLGFLVRSVERMVFLMVPADISAMTLFQPPKQGRLSGFANIARSSNELQRMLPSLVIPGAPILMIELVNPIQQLNFWLAQIPAVKRGRK